jgi:hypothetical protein
MPIIRRNRAHLCVDAGHNADLLGTLPVAILAGGSQKPCSLAGFAPYDPRCPSDYGLFTYGNPGGTLGNFLLSAGGSCRPAFITSKG